MSRTDKDRPHRVQLADPLNRRFRMVGNHMWGTDPWEYSWKKLYPAAQCMCCSNRYFDQFKRKRRSGWRREERW